MRRYMERLRRDGEPLVVERQVEARHELAAVTDKVQRTVNKPLLFERVSGTALPVLTNIYGRRERLAGILGIAPTASAATGAGWASTPPRPSPGATTSSANASPAFAPPSAPRQRPSCEAARSCVTVIARACRKRVLNAAHD